MLRVIVGAFVCVAALAFTFQMYNNPGKEAYTPVYKAPCPDPAPCPEPNCPHPKPCAPVECPSPSPNPCSPEDCSKAEPCPPPAECRTLMAGPWPMSNPDSLSHLVHTPSTGFPPILGPAYTYIEGAGVSLRKGALSPELNALIDNGEFVVNIVMRYDITTHAGGPRKVSSGLMKGLASLGIPWVLNSPNPAHVTYSQGPEPLNEPGFMERIFCTQSDRAVLLGPSIDWTFQKQITAFRCSDGSDPSFSSVLAISPSQQHIDTELARTIIIPCRMAPWPVGIDQYSFAPARPRALRLQSKNVLVYQKQGRTWPALVSKIKALGFTPVTFTYGGYNEATFRSTLNDVAFAAVADGPETQGVANLEILAMDVPVYILPSNGVRPSFPYFNETFGMRGDPAASNLDAFLAQLPSFRPRDWLLENMSLEQGALDFLRIAETVAGSWGSGLPS